MRGVKHSTSEIIELGLAILFLILLYWPVSLGIFTMKWDMLDWFYPMRQLISDSLRAHILPLWNPYIQLGFPIFADPQSGALYPITWVISYVFDYDIYVIGFDYFLHILIGFWGFKKLGQSLGWSHRTAIVLGVTYAGCGFFVSNAQHLTYVISAAWLPWIVYSYWELWKSSTIKSALSLSFFMGMLLTGGYPAFFITISYGLLFYFFYYSIRKVKNNHFSSLSKIVKMHFIALICFLLQTACFLYYFIQSMPLINRTTGLSIEQAQTFPFSPMTMISLLIPHAITSNHDFWQTSISMANGYIGISTLVLIAFSISYNRSRIIWKLILVSLLFYGISLGDFFVLRKMLYEYVPLMNLFRYPALFRIFFMFGMLLIAGNGLAYFKIKKAEVNLQKFNIIIVLFIVITILSSIFLFRNLSVLTDDPSANSLVKLIPGGLNFSTRILIQSVIQVLVLSTLFYFFRKRIIGGIYIVLLLDIFCAVQMNTFITIVSDEKIDILQNKIDQYPKGFLGDLRPVEGVSHTGKEDFYPIFYNKSMLRKDIAKNGYNNLRLRDYENFYKEESRRKTLLWHLPFFTQPESTVKLLHFTPTELILETDTTIARQLIYTQINYPGWKAELDGHSVPLSIDYAPLLCVEIPPGKHKIRFRFAPSFIKPLIWTSLISTVVIFIVIFVPVFNYKKMTDT